ncbi:hypothetical protein Tco_0816709 [Tanacetum coccineum]
MVALKFVETHNLVAFLEKPKENDGFAQIVDFLNVHPINYALTVNPTIYTSCIKQFWATAKTKTVNGDMQIQALVDGKRVIVTEASVRRDLQLAIENGTEFLPNATIFAELERMGSKTTAWNEFSSTMASVIICLATNQKFNFSKYIFDNTVKNLVGGVKFLMYLRFVQVFLDKQVEEMSKHKEIYVTLSYTKKVFANMKRQGKDFSGKDTPLFQIMMVQAQEEGEGGVPTHSNDPLLSGEDRLKLNELMELCTSLSQRVLALETTKTNQALEIDSLKRRVKKLEKKKGSRTHRLKILSRLERKILDLDADAEVTLVYETQGRNDDNLMFDTGVLYEQEVEVEKVVSTTEVTTVSATIVIVDELTLAQTLLEIKAAKPKVVTTAATTTTTAVTRPKARGAKDKGKAKMIEPEKPLKRKDQIMIDEEIAQKLQAQLDVELEEEENLARQREEDANITEWDNVQAMMDAYYELAARLQAQEQEELTIEERSKMFVELMNKRKKHIARLRVEDQLKTKSFKDIQMLFDKAMTRVNTFVDMDTELVKGSETRTEGSSKRTREELQSINLKMQKLDENVEAEVDDDQEESR